MVKFNKEELLLIRSALLNFKKAPWISKGEEEIIKTSLKKIFNLFNE
jgi:hypothetical protein